MSQDARLDEEQATQRRARVLGIDYVDTSTMPDKPLYKDLLAVPEMYELKIVPVRVDANNILFGITTTTSHQTINSLQQRFLDQRVTMAIISDAGFREYMKLYDPPKQVIYHDIAINTAGSEELVEKVSASLEQVRADDMLAYLVAQAHNLNASDIHLETQTDHARIRFRIDGVLHPIARLKPDKYRILISAIASAGNVSTAADQAQQGHIAQKVRMADGNQVDVNVRLETVPTINGMDVVMRLFNMDASMYTLDRLGLSESERKVVDGIIAKPTGLVMVVGPTGSGKTTTLYSMLNTLNTEERKIITIEDPVEYQFPGISQISVHSTESGNDESFADKLRAVLRLDPDIVMVGEIRDMDTAKTALQAALTGHLVLATFHASSAAAALTRIADIIGQNPLFVSAIRLVMAQRLIRRLDDATKQGYSPSEAEWQKINEVLETLPHGVERPNLDGLQLYKPGSSPENPYGFQGQLAIREQFMMSDELRKVLENTKLIVTTQTIEGAALESGMLTMIQDGMLKVIAGQTTLEVSLTASSANIEKPVSICFNIQMSRALRELSASQDFYRPDDYVLNSLAAKKVHLLTVTGPFGVGKNGLMKAVVALEPEVGIAKGFTTRQQRNKEAPDQYEFKGNTPETIYKLYQQMDRGILLQYAVAPFNGHVYGSYLENYSSETMLRDTMASALPQLERLPFHRLTKLAVAASVQDWRRMSSGRYQQHTPSEITGRVVEGIDSLKTMLEAGDEVSWIGTRYREPNVAAHEVLGLIGNTGEPDPANRVMGEDLLAHLKTLI